MHFYKAFGVILMHLQVDKTIQGVVFFFKVLGDWPFWWESRPTHFVILITNYLLILIT
jgi:hypothetical protein